MALAKQVARLNPKTSSSVFSLRSADQPQDQKPRALRALRPVEPVEISQVRGHLRVVVHCELDQNPDASDSDLAEAVKVAAARMRVADFYGAKVTAIIDAVRGRRARRSA